MTREFDPARQTLRELNAALHTANGSSELARWRVLNPRGLHNVAVGVDAPSRSRSMAMSATTARA